MTEREYIDTTDLGKIISIIGVARNICPENMSKINCEKFRKAYSLLYDIQDNLFEKAKITTKINKIKSK